MLVGDRIQGFKVNIKPEKKSKLSSVVLKIRGISSFRSKATINDFLSIADDTAAGATGQLELLSTAIMDGWMAGLGVGQPPTTDALGQLLSEYARCLYTSQLQHLKDIAGTLATEAAEDSAQVAKLRSALESVDHKRRKILQQMKNGTEMLNLESGAAPIRSPSTSAEDARLVSLISLNSILKQVKV
ncbi:kinesin-like protein KIN-14L isoform X1 [Salvia splendens]|nr:kinesin-like protein KIN-14L isoform X1 [Salvia splendens]XP_042037813.1 kinesin-like protein KIN-14L isoform X1 [Salvia splendens]XP_042037814.1 kinesin-like protein KIN-14L isoform X1 [Salvia splendens]XP_042037815.1 kinesin-like protein KIN-14L isoform X1 [Salvia splendens]